MDEASSSPAANPANRRKNRRRQQLTILIACVLIATILWFLRAFENDYTTRVDHPVRYVNMPDKMMTLNPLPQRISLEVKGLGFSIVRHNWNFSKTPLVIDIMKLVPQLTKRKKGFDEYLPMNQFFNDFSAQLKDLKVLEVSPDTLMFRFAFRKSRNIKVIQSFTYDSDTFIIPDSLVRITPDSVQVEGPDLILDTMGYIRTLPVKITRQGATISRSVGLVDINKLVKVNPAKVTVSIGKKP